MNREIQLDAHEARLFGVLIEKALTTPDQYPLSINAATNGANQKVNRDPVLALEEYEVASALERLQQKYLARKVFPANSRVEKFCHNGKDGLGLDAPALAVLAELLMRGPQTPGELRTRAGRMTPIESIEKLMEILTPLMEQGLIRRIASAPGSRAERYVQLLSPDLHPVEARAAAPIRPDAPSHLPSFATLVERVQALEAAVARLQQEIEPSAGGSAEPPQGQGPG
jgi:uncharacterized protein YceH (UPF0502 family)